MKAWAKAHASPAATGPQTLSYGGGIDGIGVTSGTPKVYLVFYGTQWGTAGHRRQRQPHVLRRRQGRGAAAPADVQGPRHQRRAVVRRDDPVLRRRRSPPAPPTCPASGASTSPTRPAARWPASGTTTSASPQPRPRGHQLGSEAVSAAAHFGNTTAASNRYAQYVILSPHGTNPDSFKTPGGFCAWHDWNGDPSAVPRPRPYGDIAFTNMPYVSTWAPSCGAELRQLGPRHPRRLHHRRGPRVRRDHHRPEPGRRLDRPHRRVQRQENADECAWISTGPGRRGQRRHGHRHLRRCRAPGPTTPTAARSRTRSSAAAAAPTPSRSPTRATRPARSARRPACRSTPATRRPARR